MPIFFDLREGAGMARQNLMKPDAVGLPAPDYKNETRELMNNLF